MVATPIDTSLRSLYQGPVHRFAEWPNRGIPRVAAGAYTVWDGSQFVYVGMAGRALSPEKAARLLQEGKRCGLYDRLNSHASGRRSGDQFCVYVFDRLVLPSLQPSEIEAAADGGLSLDERTRVYIRSRLSYRFVVTDDDKVARRIEEQLRAGAGELGRPLLNPLGPQVLVLSRQETFGAGGR